MFQRPIVRLASSLPTLSVHHQLCRLSSQPFCRLSSSRLTFSSSPPATRTHSSHTRSFHCSPHTLRTADPYSVLGVGRTASKEDIKSAYYKLAKQLHPDTHNSTHTASPTTDKAKADRFHRVQAAYETLSDASKKAAYDRDGGSSGSGGYGGDGSGGGGSTEEWSSWYEEMSRQAGRSSSTSSGGSRRSGRGWMEFDADEFIHDLFGTWKGYTARSSSSSSGQLRRTKGADLQSDMTLSFLDAIHGTTKTIAYTVDDACTACHATGKQPGGKKKHCSACQGKGYRVMGLDRGVRARVECEECGGEGRLWPLCGGCSGSGVVKEQRQVDVKIPAGVSENTNVRLLGMGDAGKRGGKRGNLRIRIHIADDTDGRRRDGSDVHSDLNLTLPQAILGLHTTVHTVHGPDRLHVPSGVQHGAVIRVKGRGVRLLNGGSGEAGDHVVHVRVRIPGQADMSGEQVEMMRQWAVAQQAQKDEEDSAAAKRTQREQQQQVAADQQHTQHTEADEVERLETMKQHDSSKQSRRKGMGKTGKLRKPRSRAVWQDETWDDEDGEEAEAEAEEEEEEEVAYEWEEDGEENGSETRNSKKKRRRQRSRS